MLRPIRLSLAESSRTLLALRLSLAESSRVAEPKVTVTAFAESIVSAHVVAATGQRPSQDSTRYPASGTALNVTVEPSSKAPVHALAGQSTADGVV